MVPPLRQAGKARPLSRDGCAGYTVALADAGLDYADVQQAYVGYVYGDSTAAQCALYEVGMTSIPIINVNNNCSTGSTALFLARQAVRSGVVDCALALGFEHMAPGALAKKGGALEFIEIESQATNQHGDPVARIRSVTVVRN
ncbi:thiolase-like protein [Paraburkholderia silvatlantica]|nr:thiolase-like protein [Paraburkholderia silvatlantica]PXW34486.1 thiolase-like protein [Paraburkholderia silvatlantica]